MTAPSTLRAGLCALAKVLLVVAGVPLALVRLWTLAPLPRAPMGLGALARLSTWSHLLLVAVGAVWVLATVRLLRELWGAIHHREVRASPSWSTRWASELAGLLLVATSSTLVSSALAQGAAARARTTPRERPAAGSSAPSTSAARDSTARRLEELAAVAVGALGAVALRRRVRSLRRVVECLRGPGERATPATRRAAAYETMLACLGGEEILDFVEAANRLLWAALADRREPAPDVRLVRCGREGVELLLEVPVTDPPAPFRSRGSGRWWVLEPAQLRAPAPEGAGRFLPYLVPVGDDEDASYLVVLRPGRRLGLLGEAADVERVLAGIVLGLRTLPWAEELDVELFGLAAPPAAERCYQLHASSAAALDELRARHGSGPRGLARWRREPLAVVAGDAAREPGLAEGLTASMGVVVGGEQGTETLLLGARDGLLSPFGIPLHPPRLPARELALVEELLASASRPARRVGAVTRADMAEADARRPGSVELVLFAAEPHLRGAVPLGAEDERRVAEFVAHLLTNGRAASVEELGAALLPFARRARDVRVANLAALARSALGEGADGRSLVSPLLEGRYHLAPEVSGDWLRLRSLAALARTAAPGRATALLRSALELVGARPPGGRGTGFGFFASFAEIPAATADAIDAAHHLATLSIAGGDLDEAGFALARGLLVEPCSEMLVRDAMVLCELRGDLPGLDAQLARLEDGLVELGTEPSAETLALYEQLRSHLLAPDRDR